MTSSSLRHGGDQALQASPADSQVGERPVDVTARSLQVGDRLPARLRASDMCRIFEIGSSRFYVLVNAGRFDHFELRPRIGRRAWSGALVEKYLACEPGASRWSFAPVGKRKSA